MQVIDFDQCQLNLEFFDKFEGGSDYFDPEFNNRVETEKRNFEKKIIELSKNIRFKNPKTESDAEQMLKLFDDLSYCQESQIELGKLIKVNKIIENTVHEFKTFITDQEYKL